MSHLPFPSTTSAGQAERGRPLDADDPAVAQQHGRVRPSRSAGGVDQIDMDDRDRPSWSQRTGRCQEKRSKRGGEGNSAVNLPVEKAIDGVPITR